LYIDLRTVDFVGLFEGAFVVIYLLNNAEKIYPNIFYSYNFDYTYFNN